VPGRAVEGPPERYDRPAPGETGIGAARLGRRHSLPGRCAWVDSNCAVAVGVTTRDGGGREERFVFEQSFTKHDAVFPRKDARTARPCGADIVRACIAPFREQHFEFSVQSARGRRARGLAAGGRACSNDHRESVLKSVS